ncbi:AhpD-like protein [Bisporella sp. PMI_857]|nr:AhpD-like protein [Bisporella sp. PMI_857]
MPLIPYRDASVLPIGIPPLNLFRMWAHSPSTLPHIISLGTTVFRDTSISPHLRELLCLLNASVLSCDYQWKQHAFIAKQNGVSEKQIAALLAGDISGNDWSPEERALLEFVDQVIRGPEVAQNVFMNARDYFSDQALVEIVTMQGFYYSLARIATVFQVEIEQTSKVGMQKALDARNKE